MPLHETTAFCLELERREAATSLSGDGCAACGEVHGCNHSYADYMGIGKLISRQWSFREKYPAIPNSLRRLRYETRRKMLQIKMARRPPSALAGLAADLQPKQGPPEKS
jgi:hypothetical protein